MINVRNKKYHLCPELYNYYWSDLKNISKYLFIICFTKNPLGRQLYYVLSYLSYIFKINYELINLPLTRLNSIFYF